MSKVGSIVVLFIALAVAACGSNKSDLESMATAVTMSEVLAPSEDAVVWIVDEQGQRASYWIRGNATGIDVIASRPELVVPAGETLWLLRERDETDTDGPLIELVDLRSRNAIKLPVGDPASTDQSECQATRGLEGAVPLASVGPFLFFRYQERAGGCDEDEAQTLQRLAVFDLGDGREADILDEAELDALLESEPVAREGRATDLELAGIEPRYGPGGDLNLTYLFFRETSRDVSEHTSQSLEEWLEVPASKAPKVLVPYVVPPPSVNTFCRFNTASRLGGWGLIQGSPEQLEERFRAFASE